MSTTLPVRFTMEISAYHPIIKIYPDKHSSVSSFVESVLIIAHGIVVASIHALDVKNSSTSIGVCHELISIQRYFLFGHSRLLHLAIKFDPIWNWLWTYTKSCYRKIYRLHLLLEDLIHLYPQDLNY